MKNSESDLRYPQSKFVPESLTLEELEAPLLAGRRMLHARFPLIAIPEEVHAYYGNKKVVSPFSWQVALHVLGILQTPTPLSAIGGGPEPITRLKTYVELRPTPANLIFFDGYAERVETQEDVRLAREELEESTADFQEARVRLDDLCAKDTQLISVPVLKDVPPMEATYVQLQGLIRGGGRRNLVQQRIEALRKRRGQIAFTSGITTGRAQRRIQEATTALENAIESYWGPGYVDDIEAAVRESLLDLEVGGQALEEKRIPRKFADGVADNRANLYALGAKAMGLGYPRESPVNSMFISIDQIEKTRSDEGINLVIGDGPVKSFAPRVRRELDGSPIETVGPIFVWSETESGMYGICLSQEVWMPAVMNAERLREAGIIDHLLSTWRPAVIDERTGQTLEAHATPSLLSHNPTFEKTDITGGAMLS